VNEEALAHWGAVAPKETTNNIINNAVYDLTSIKILFAPFVGTDSVLIRYFNGYTK
jgi:hypothetical protein